MRTLRTFAAGATYVLTIATYSYSVPVSTRKRMVEVQNRHKEPTPSQPRKLRRLGSATDAPEGSLLHADMGSRFNAD